MTTFKSKLVVSPHYHLWTDALHLRALAHQARNRWDRGTYVRTTVTNAWTTLETACNDALEVTNIGYSFRKNLDAAIDQKGLPRLDWSQGVWKDVSELSAWRKEFLHKGISERNRFAATDKADKAIDVCRFAIKSVYLIASKPAPHWVDDNDDPGFDQQSAGLAAGHLIRAGVDRDNPNTVKIAYVYKDREYTDSLSAAGTDHKPLLDHLIQRIRVPITMVRAYRGQDLLEERELVMRGN